ncbi:hypothetical protein EC973_003393 [Apophysomyces ossiformis]|uniref:Alpha/beta hydrolase fold-3 domain-containing protein n=1 Tax=Apophysomyces ossiformis TaxID=679940 RepID=A0A8H7BVT7_9FUNG|nr:hypothetical protein EC973_003393 [Apophysomyces ossiformis]
MTVVKLVQPCSIKGCCLPTAKGPVPIIIPEKTTLEPVLVRELCQSIGHIPISIFRLVSDLWLHITCKPKRPSWDLQTTIIMSILQAARDQSMANSLGFWRLVLVTPRIFTPRNCTIEDGSFYAKHRGLCGILKQADADEDGTRLIQAEWMLANPGQKQSHKDSIKHNQFWWNSKNDKKTILYIHGGGFCTMNAQTYRSLTYKLSKTTHRKLLAVNYRLSPEVRFPGQLYDAVQTFFHLIDEGLGYKAENILLMGDSAGAGLCLAMMLYLRDHGLPQPEGAVLLSPWVDMTYSYPSWNDASLYDYLPPRPKASHHLNPALFYLHPDQFDSLIRHPYVSPIFTDHFEHLPPMLIQSGGCDTLRDEIRDIASKISASKTTIVYYEEYEDMVHVFQALPFCRSREAIESIGWWTKAGIALIQESWKRSSLQNSSNHCQAEDKELVTSYKRRGRSIPG